MLFRVQFGVIHRLDAQLGLLLYKQHLLLLQLLVPRMHLLLVAVVVSMHFILLSRRKNVHER